MSEQQMTGREGGTAALPAGEPILRMQGISKRYGAVQALTDVDFEVYPGEVVALVGDNGAGKSTLIKCVAGTHTPDEGTIFFEGSRSRSTTQQTPPGWGSRPSTRTSRCATTSTSSRTCSWAVR